MTTADLLTAMAADLRDVRARVEQLEARVFGDTVPPELEQAVGEPPAGVTVGACRSCRAPIVWTRTEHGKRMPVDARADPSAARSTFALRDLTSPEGPLAVAMTRAQAPAGERLYVSHFATCPDSAQHRRPR